MTTLPDLLYVALCGHLAASGLLGFLAGISSPVAGRSGSGANVALGMDDPRSMDGGRSRGGAVGLERPILAVGGILRTRRLSVVDIHRVVSAAGGLPHVCGRALARSVETRASARQQIGTLTAVLPHTASGLRSITPTPSEFLASCSPFLARTYLSSAFVVESTIAALSAHLKIIGNPILVGRETASDR